MRHSPRVSALAATPRFPDTLEPVTLMRALAIGTVLLSATTILVACSSEPSTATEEADGRFAFSVRNKRKLKGFAWVWMERVVPKKPRGHRVKADRALLRA